MRFNTLGNAVYGSARIAIDGAIPAALASVEAGKGVWLDADTVVFQDCGVGGVGPCVLNQITYPGGVVTSADAQGANFLWGGGGIWAALLGSLGGTRTNDPDLGPWVGSGVADISFEGLVVRIDDYQQGGGLTIFDDSGAVVSSLFEDVITGWNFSIRLRDRYLSYPDAQAKWHIKNIDTGQPITWFPRVDGVVRLTPVVHNGQVWVIEADNASRLTIRQANKARGWVLVSTPTYFFPDAVSLNSTTIRVGCCTEIGEGPNTLTTFDCVVGAGDTLIVTPYTVVGGMMVAGTPVTLQATDEFTVSVIEGGTLTPPNPAPVGDPISDSKTALRPTRPWINYFNKLDRQLTQLGGLVQDQPLPLPGGDGFNQILPEGQPSLVSTNANQTLILTSDDGSIEFVADPNGNVLDISVRGGGGGYAPVTTGAEPLVFVSDGAGHPLMTPYTP